MDYAVQNVLAESNKIWELRGTIKFEFLYFIFL